MAAGFYMELDIVAYVAKEHRLYFELQTMLQESSK